MLIIVNSLEAGRGSYTREIPFIETTAHLTSVSTRGVIKGGDVHPRQMKALTGILFNLKSFVR